MDDLPFVMIINVKDPIIYDVVFIRDQPVIENALPSEDVVGICELDPVTLKRGEEKHCHAYRLKIANIIPRVTNMAGEVKYELLHWLNTNGCVFKCRFVGTDEFGRVLADIIDPVTLVSVADWIMDSYSNLYERRH